MKEKGTLLDIPDNCFIGIDAEWTKNYKVKNGNVPFCFSIITIDKNEISFQKLKNGEIVFKYIQFYCENREEFKDLVTMADLWASKILKTINNNVLCGHQVSSDFSVLYNIGVAYNIKSTKNIEQLHIEWKKRKLHCPIHIIDTRYDIYQDFLGKSRRLVDICNDFKLDVTQPELKRSSMTKLQNKFYDNKDENIYERISVMNLRHSLCAVVLHWLNLNVANADQRHAFNINKSIYSCLKNDFKWVSSEEFMLLLKSRK